MFPVDSCTHGDSENKARFFPIERKDPIKNERSGARLAYVNIQCPISSIAYGHRIGRYSGYGRNDDNSVVGTFSGDATAEAGNILSGKTAYVKGAKVTGTMVDHTGVPDHINDARLANNRFEVAVHRGFHNWSWSGGSYEYLEYNQVASVIGLTADKIKKGVSIIGVTGTVTEGEEYYIPDISTLSITGTSYPSGYYNIGNNYRVRISVSSTIANALRKGARYVVLQNNMYDENMVSGRYLGLDESYAGVLHYRIIGTGGTTDLVEVKINDVVMALLDGQQLILWGTSTHINDSTSDYLYYAMIVGGSNGNSTLDLQIILRVHKSQNTIEIFAKHDVYEVQFVRLMPADTSMHIIM